MALRASRLEARPAATCVRAALRVGIWDRPRARTAPNFDPNASTEISAGAVANSKLVATLSTASSLRDLSLTRVAVYQRCERRVPLAREEMPAHTTLRALRLLPWRSFRPLSLPPLLAKKGHLDRHLSRALLQISLKSRPKNLRVRGLRDIVKRCFSSRARSRIRSTCTLHWRTQWGAENTPSRGARAKTGRPRRIVINLQSLLWSPPLSLEIAARALPPRSLK